MHSSKSCCSDAPTNRAQAVYTVLRDPGSQKPQFDLAVQFFNAALDGRDGLIWQNVLNRADDLSERGWAAVKRILSNERYLEEAFYWIRRTPSSDRRKLGASFEAILRLIAQTPGLIATEQFVQSI